MTREEAEKLSDSPEIADKLIGMFEKEIEQYTREDFIDGTEPYDYLMLFKDDLFTLERKKQKIDAIARKCGVKNFSKLFKEYCANCGENISDYNVTNFPDQPISLRCGNYICDFNGVKLDMEMVCPHPIMPVCRLVNIDTGIEKIKIAFSRGRGWRTAIFDRKTISTANKITDLSDIGISVTSESAKGLVRYFSKLEELNSDVITETECVTRMGWITDDDEYSFIPYVNDIVFDGEADYKKHFEAVKSKGSFDKWVDFIDENIRSNNVIARVVFAASLASVLIKPLNCSPFFIHLWGESESAKTVLMMCAASIWANPVIGEYIKTFNSTLVGCEKTAAFFNSLPYMMDELQIINERKDFEKEIYMLTEGVGRSRGNKTGGLDHTPTWRNCIMTTGEKPILTSSSGGGAVNRVIEVECKEKFFKNPREVVKFISNNYGFFGKVFVAKLKKDNFAEADRYFTAFYNELVGEYGITQKQAQSAALILTADKIATDMIFDDGRGLTAKEISEFLKTKSAMSINPRAYEYVCEYVAANQNKFNGSTEFGECWGVMSCTGGVVPDMVYIMRNKFNQICEEGGYNGKALLSYLNDKGLLKRTDNKHLDVVKRIGSASVRCVCIMLPEQSGVSDNFEDYDF